MLIVAVNNFSSLWLTCFRLCGYPPFEGDNNKEIFKNVLKQDLVFDPTDWSSVSKEAKDLVSKMLEKDPEHRITAD